MLMFCHIPNLVMNYGVYVLILYYVYLTRYFYHLILLLLISSSHDTVSWLDHVLSTTSGHYLFTNISVKFDFITSDYLPLCFSISIDNMHVPIPPADSTSRDLFSYNWYGAFDVNLSNYNSCTRAELAKIKLPFDARQ